MMNSMKIEDLQPGMLIDSGDTTWQLVRCPEHGEWIVGGDKKMLQRANNKDKYLWWAHELGKSELILVCVGGAEFFTARACSSDQIDTREPSVLCA